MRTSLAAALLSGCDPSVRESEAYNIAEDVADAKVAALAGRVDDLEAQVSDLESRVDAAQLTSINNVAATDRLRNVVNENADVLNKKALADATARGACGTNLINHGGWIENRPVQCTPKLMGWE